MALTYDVVAICTVVTMCIEYVSFDLCTLSYIRESFLCSHWLWLVASIICKLVSLVIIVNNAVLYCKQLHYSNSSLTSLLEMSCIRLQGRCIYEPIYMLMRYIKI